jgi:hypothetical protein
MISPFSKGYYHEPSSLAGGRETRPVHVTPELGQGKDENFPTADGFDADPSELQPRPADAKFESMLIYLDMCSIHRPLDDKTQFRILVESEAVLGIIALCESGQLGLVPSEALEYETGRNPNPERKAYALEVLCHARQFVSLSPKSEGVARVFQSGGPKPLDALHLACAVEAGVDDFCTCDDRLLKRARAIHDGPPKVVRPLELIGEIGP